MYRMHCVLALVTLSVGLAHSFSWEIVMCGDNRLDFIDINGTVTYTQIMSSERIYRPTFDPVHNRVLFTDRHNIYFLDVATKKTEIIRSDTHTYFTGLTYDPATDLLFWVENYKKLYTISLTSELNKNQWNKKHLIRSDENKLSFLAVDSCGGFIYWKFLSSVYRIRLNGTEMQVVFSEGYVRCMTIDKMSQKVYWANDEFAIKSVDFNGKNNKTIVRSTYLIDYLTVSKDFIYYVCHDGENFNIMQIPKNSPHMNPKVLVQLDSYFPAIVANYDIEDYTRENQNCDTLKNQKPNKSVPTDVSPSCVHGTRISGESRCECAQGYSGESCEVPVCHNYCIHGNCSVSAEGQPKCRCDPGYSGERCQVSACPKSEPVCQCTGDYESDSCNVSVCRGYCLHGNCSTSADGKPKCSCYAGYSGEQCEFPACHGYCLNHGVCSLSEKSEPVCRCTGNYEGERCEFPAFIIECSQRTSVRLKDVLATDVTTDKEVQSSCTSTAF